MIGGLHRCSFIDFPGRLSAVVFLRGCNLRCPYCHNAELIADGPGLIDEADLEAFLTSRRGRLDGVVFSGGEPTLRPELPGLIDRARALGYAVKLDTNGTRPDVLAALLDRRALDYVAVDFKDEPAAYTDWLSSGVEPEAVVRSLALVGTATVEHELRTTVVWPHHDPDRLDRMAAWVRDDMRWILQRYRRPEKKTIRDDGIQEPPPGYLEEQAARLRERYGLDCRTRRAAIREEPPAGAGGS